MTKAHLIVRDLRSAGRFFIDDVFYDFAYANFDIYCFGVYAALCRHADKNQTCFPSIPTVARNLGISVRVVMRSIQILESKNVVSVDRTSGRSNNYYLLDRKYWMLSSSDVLTTSAPHAPVITTAVLPSHALHPCTTCTTPVHHMHPKETQVRKHNKETQANFDLFWKTYPKKRSKGQAERAWTRINPDEILLTKIISAVAIAKKSKNWLKKDGEYIPYPATWLNAKAWEDEITDTFHKSKKPDSKHDACGGTGYLPDNKKCWCWQ